MNSSPIKQNNIFIISFYTSYMFPVVFSDWSLGYLEKTGQAMSQKVWPQEEMGSLENSLINVV